MNRNDPWLCKKCFFIKRKKQQSRVISFFVWKTPEAWLRGSFCFLLYDAVNQLTGLGKVLHNFLEILLHIGITPFLSIDRSALCPGILGTPRLLHNTVVQVAGLGEVLHHFSKILLHVGIAPFFSIDSQSPLPGQI